MAGGWDDDGVVGCDDEPTGEAAGDEGLVLFEGFTVLTLVGSYWYPPADTGGIGRICTP